MAVTDSYADATRYKTIFDKTSPADDGELTLQLKGMSRVMERDIFGGRFFTKDTAVTIRRYYPMFQGDSLNVNDIADVAGLIVKVDDNEDGTAETVLTQTTQYELQPFNAATGPEPAPYTYLYLPTRSSRYWYPSRLVEVTAIHGWPAVPDAIIQACCQLVALLRLETPRATQMIQEGIGAVVGTAPAAQSIVDRLSRAYAIPAWAR